MEVYSKDKLLRPFQSECDLYCEVKSFILQAQAQTDAQRELGMLTVVYINYVEHLERQKLIAIKEVIGSYL